ncbi:MAG: DegT/DnrJ/EryC1/StrS family aminotransferase, partial [Candidatus Wallbacteria bacterium]|nr:DegT/DnrJ/EryC1/StrS family aminotransferase [Candidatus Wallbacteria bacterium]
PVFCDINKSFNIDPHELEKRLTGRTKALIPVHLYGQPCDMDEILSFAAKHKLAVVEDCAQSTGAKYRERKTGSLGDLGCFSFYPTKNLGAFGDGGCVTTDNDELAQKLRILRTHGAKKKYHHTMIGLNSRLDEMQAAVLNVKLPLLDEWNLRRKELAERYHSGLKEVVEIPLPEPGRDHIYHTYVIRHPNRDGLREKLEKSGVSTMVYYPRALHHQVCFESFGQSEVCCPEAEKACLENLALPMYPELTDKEADFVIDAVKRAV